MKLSLDKQPRFKSRFNILLTVLLMVALSACTTPRIRTHTLVPPPQIVGTGSNIDAIIVAHVSVPPQLNRTEMVLRKGNSQLVILESDWWGAPLPEEIRSALATRLGQAAGSGYPTRIWVTVTRFDAVPGQNVWLDADYRLSGNPDLANAELTCNIRSRNDAGTTIDSLVRAHQLNIEALAEAIVATVRKLNAGDRACP